jgi:hypothetical protein
MAQSLLCRCILFDWPLRWASKQPETAVKSDGHAVAHLLDICRRNADGFTLAELVSQVLRERPAMISEFAYAWDEMQRCGLVRVIQMGRPSIYQVVHGGDVTNPAAHS